MKDRSLPRLGAACGIFSVVLEIAGIGVSVVSAPELVDATLGSSEEEIARAFASPATTGVWVADFPHPLIRGSGISNVP